MAVRDIDKGWNNILRELKRADGSFTKVGVPQETKVASAKKSKKGRKPITATSELVKIAAINEFGAPKRNIPARPAHKQAFDNNKEAISRFKQKVIGSMYDNKIDFKAALGLLGEFVTAKIKRQITKLSSPPNAAATVKKKGSSNPLIDLSQLRNSQTHVEVFR